MHCNTPAASSVGTMLGKLLMQLVAGSYIVAYMHAALL
jgi:hypothetical protein